MKSLLTTLAVITSFLLFAGNKTYQAIDTNGNVLFEIEAERLYDFSDGLAVMQQVRLENNQWIRGQGYINRNGEIAIPCHFKKAKDFVDGRAWVQNSNGKWQLIDKKGTFVSSKEYEKVGPLLEGYSDRIAVYEDGLLGWIDRDGNQIIACQYYGSALFDKEFGLACVTKPEEEKYGFINKNGDVVIPFQYVQAGTSSFHNGLCRVTINGKTVLIDEKGEVQFNGTYRSLQNYSHGLMAAATKPARKGWGYVNMKNEMVVPAIYDHATTLNEDGYGIIELADKKGLIDSTGTIVLELKYETIYADVTRDGYICAVLPREAPTALVNAAKDYFNADLEPIDIPNVTLMSSKGTNRIPFIQDGNYGYMNRTYAIVIQPIYKRANAFSEGIAIVQLN